MKFPFSPWSLLFFLTAWSVASADASEIQPAVKSRPFAAVNLGSPRAIAIDSAGNLYVIDVESATLHKITPAGEASVVRERFFELAEAEQQAVYRFLSAL